MLRISMILALAFVIPAGSCSLSYYPDDDPYYQSAPNNEGFDYPDGPPDDGAPTGTRWVEAPVDEGCGRTGRTWILADETCAETDSEGYFDTFVAPMFRDGAMIGDRLFTVDATHLWVLDVRDPEAIRREVLISGLGRPLALRALENRLVIASAEYGLVVADVADVQRPGLVGQVPLRGPAMDVVVIDRTAYVASGAGGLAIVDLDSLTVLDIIPLPGFAAGVDVQDTLAYVAACDSLVIIDLEAMSMVGSVWLDDAEPEDAPAKDVEIVGHTAFVAAGRYGAVAVDVSAPYSPSILGNCTVAEDMIFYASGVRAEGNNLYVAGGEWGILPVPLDDSEPPCSSIVVPTLLTRPPDEPDEECGTEPPWEVLDWQEIWEPPPPST